MFGVFEQQGHPRCWLMVGGPATLERAQEILTQMQALYPRTIYEIFRV